MTVDRSIHRSSPTRRESLLSLVMAQKKQAKAFFFLFSSFFGSFYILVTRKSRVEVYFFFVCIDDGAFSMQVMKRDKPTNRKETKKKSQDGITDRTRVFRSLVAAFP